MEKFTLYGMGKGKKEKWMGMVLDLYRQGFNDGERNNDLLIEGREKLYSKMIVIIGRMKSMIYQDHRHDKVQDFFLQCDKWVKKSIEMGFHEKQVYTYIKTRVRGLILNHNKKIKKEQEYLTYSSYINTIEKDEVSELITGQRLSLLFMDFIFNHCNEKQQRLLMLITSDEDFSISDIAKYLGRDNKTISRRAYNLKSKFKKYLDDNDFSYEDLC